MSLLGFVICILWRDLAELAPPWGMSVFGKLYRTIPHLFLMDLIGKNFMNRILGSQFSDKLNKQTCDL